jgi:dienelactone hydrolase
MARARALCLAALLSIAPLSASAQSPREIPVPTPVPMPGQDRMPPNPSIQDYMIERMLRDSVPKPKPAEPPVQKAEPQQTATIAGLQVAVWLPAGNVPRPMPTIVFSHGQRGCNTQSSFLMRALADKGYAVLAPNHHDAHCTRGSNRAKPAELRFEKPGAWNDTSYEDRRDDIAKLLDALQKEVPWSSLVDKTRIGLAGHSLGGYTVLGVAGGWESWKRKDVKAVLAMAPFVEPFTRHGALDRIEAAVMYQGGASDLSITPSLRRPAGAYDKTPSPVWFVELKLAGHLAWTDLIPKHQDTIVHYALAFFDTTLRNADAAPLRERYGDASDVRWKK